ncbi:hypothetical protein ACFL5O_06305 [Myxococcota bacterium]
MAGRIRQLIDELSAVRGKGQSGIGHFLRAHLILQGINPDRHTASSPDDPEKIRILQKMLRDFGDNNTGLRS